MNDQGQFSVGTMPEDGEMGMDESMQPAQSIDEALNMAREMMMGAETEMGNEQAAMRGYNKGAKPMQDKMSPARVFGDDM